MRQAAVVEVPHLSEDHLMKSGVLHPSPGSRLSEGLRKRNLMGTMKNNTAVLPSLRYWTTP